MQQICLPLRIMLSQIQTYAYAYACTHKCTHKFIQKHAHLHTPAHTQAHTHKYKHIKANTYTHTPHLFHLQTVIWRRRRQREHVVPVRCRIARCGKNTVAAMGVVAVFQVPQGFLGVSRVGPLAPNGPLRQGRCVGFVSVGVLLCYCVSETYMSIG